jgi:putative Ca2+/H+ antiporter (TMEM165/GDT1 family)
MAAFWIALFFVLIGKLMGRELPEKLIKYGAALVFIASGLFTIRGAIMHITTTS